MAMVLVKCMMVGFTSFILSDSSGVVTILIVSQLGASASLLFKIEAGLYFNRIALFVPPYKPIHYKSLIKISSPIFVL